MAALAGRTGWRLTVRLTPRASRNEIAAWKDGVLYVRVTAAPVDGKANAALRALLAETLGLPLGQVAITCGALSRTKIVDVHGRRVEDILAALERQR
jgi:uncharacterized protein (TIGR00251 family)